MLTLKRHLGFQVSETREDEEEKQEEQEVEGGKEREGEGKERGKEEKERGKEEKESGEEVEMMRMIKESLKSIKRRKTHALAQRETKVETKFLNARLWRKFFHLILFGSLVLQLQKFVLYFFPLLLNKIFFSFALYSRDV